MWLPRPHPPARRWRRIWACRLGQSSHLHEAAAFAAGGMLQIKAFAPAAPWCEANAASRHASPRAACVQELDLDGAGRRAGALTLPRVGLVPAPQHGRRTPLGVSGRDVEVADEHREPSDRCCSTPTASPKSEMLVVGLSESAG